MQLIEIPTADISLPQQRLFSTLQQGIAFTTWACATSDRMHITEIPELLCSHKPCLSHKHLYKHKNEFQLSAITRIPISVQP